MKFTDCVSVIISFSDYLTFFYLFSQNIFTRTTQMHPFAQSLFLANVRMVLSVQAITAFCLTIGNIAMQVNGRV